MFATIFGDDSTTAGLDDLFVVTLADGRIMTMTIQDVMDHTELDEVIKLLCGQTIQFHLSAKFIAAYEAIQAEIAEQEAKVAEWEQKTQEYILSRH